MSGGSSYPAYAQVIRPGTAFCGIQAEMDGSKGNANTVHANGAVWTGPDGYNYRVTSGSVPVSLPLGEAMTGTVTTMQVGLPCTGMKITVTRQAYIHGAVYPQGAKLTVTGAGKFTRISGW